MFLLFIACNNLAVEYFEAKIGLDNEASVKMFQKIGFQEVNISLVMRCISITKFVPKG
jgi:hypothetical protein